MRHRRTLKFVLVSLTICAMLGSAALGAIFWDIQKSVQERCAIAQDLYPHPGDDVLALLDYMDSSKISLRERNLAVWGLGRLCDERALPALEEAYTGELCDHSRYLCQYELEKAINRCGDIPDPPRKTRD